MFILNFYRRYREKKLYSRLGKFGRSIFIGFPNMITRPERLFMNDFTRIMNGANLILNKGKLYIGKYTAIASGFTVITDNHTPTVGVPYYFTGHYHLNDRSTDVVIEEDCWVGANVTILPGGKLGRGCVVAACALVNKEFPPYAVIAGVPAKIIGVKFSQQEIIEHEAKIYSPSERLEEMFLTTVFEKYYKDKKIMNHAILNCESKRFLEEQMTKENFPYPQNYWGEL